MKTKLIKSKSWKASNGNTGTTYTVAYQGRVFNISDTDFESDQLEIDTNSVTFLCKVVVTQEPYQDSFGNTKMGLRLKQKSDLEFSNF